MDVVKDTAGYETWLGRICPLVAADLNYKHQLMADPADPFPFFRGTYYRWVRLWPAACPDVTGAPRVLAVGDLHVENFGTWRDEDGRLCWGVNDFDEVDELPYTNDLVRLAASARFARKAGGLDLKLAVVCKALLEAYRGCLKDGGRPFVLEEQHPHLRTAAMAAERDPPHFWAKLTALLKDAPVDPPAEARAALTQDLPAAGLNPEYRARPRAGVGSLGRPRYVALIEWCGGWVCREAKAAVPAATAWVAGVTDPAANRMAEAVERAVRSPDPFYRPGPRWVARRLAPRCSRVELAHLAGADAERILHGMGAETANVHLGTPRAAEAILRDLDSRPAGWLEAAARTAADAVENDWAEWRKAAR